jgi:hypothetical protein
MPNRLKSYSVSVAVLGGLAFALILFTAGAAPQAASPGSAGNQNKAAKPASKTPQSFDGVVSRNAQKMMEQGRRIFRFDVSKGAAPPPGSRSERDAVFVHFRLIWAPG